MRMDDEINEQRNRAMNVANAVGTKFRGMTYEQGVDDALAWVTEDDTDKPLNDEDYGEFDE